VLIGRESSRGAVIDCQKDGHVCKLRMEGHPLDELGFGVAGTIMPLVDLWLDERRPGFLVRSRAHEGFSSSCSAAFRL
jgi:hypothetical protein